MSQRRTLILAAAIVIGALASFLVWNYVNGVQDEAYSNAEQVPVYLVKQAVPRGTPGLQAQAYIAKENIPRKFKPGNAITNIEDITGKIAVSDLVPNQVVVADMFVDASDPAARASFSEKLARIRNKDQVAVTISLDQVRGVAGLIAPGDFVNIMVTQVVQVGNTSDGATSADTSNESGDRLFAQQARFLYQKVEVLAVGQTAVPEAGATTDTAADAAAAAATNSGMITVIVPTKAAQYIASVPPEQLYLVLVARDYKPVAQDPIDLNALLPGEDPSQLTPYGKDGPESSN
ncbi:Flp pilus assembly protein CpaB [Aquihabitans sp. G128]|uniref:Flp pilus assembly protein CpaB n=1 Tax=Aquihabitans sp. G128 TaxID=2849779 RepID=UPI001C243DBA|nr:Flp pilus assembly protein CpaB [Aquihabitans sp. G128]QXC61684.1 Flp pilus assembly protein CpaB [Aquihabitans sp. G128]